MGINLTYVNEMVALAKEHGFTVTSTTGGTHNTGSKHGKGLAIDVRTRDKTNTQVETFIKIAKSKGYKVLDERVKPAGQKVWSGPHLHIEVVSIVEKVGEQIMEQVQSKKVYLIIIFFAVIIFTTMHYMLNHEE